MILAYPIQYEGGVAWIILPGLLPTFGENYRCIWDLGRQQLIKIHEQEDLTRLIILFLSLRLHPHRK